jgi:hypothetical protein
MTVLDNYVDRLAGMPADHFIGSILWFSIAGTIERADGKRTTVPVRVTHDQLETWFDELDLDKDFLPPRIKKVDAFRKASSQAVAEYPGPKDGQTTKLRVEEIDYNPEFVLRHILRDVHDKRTQTSTSAHVATLKFMRGGRTSAGVNASSQHYKHSINTNLIELGLDQKPTGQRYPLPEADRKMIKQVIEEFDERYTDLAANLHSDAVRAVIRNYLASLNAIGVKPSGGVYFVHTSRQPTVDALQELVRRVGQGCTFHQLPLLDTLDQRQMLTEAFQTEVQDEVDKLLKEIAGANEKARSKGNKIPPAEYAKFMDAYQDIVSRSEEYTRVLGLAQGRAGVALETALDAVVEMSGRLQLKK